MLYIFHFNQLPPVTPEWVFGSGQSAGPVLTELSRAPPSFCFILHQSLFCASRAWHTEHPMPLLAVFQHQDITNPLEAARYAADNPSAGKTPLGIGLYVPMVAFLIAVNAG